MRELQHKQRVRSWVYSKLVLFLMLILVGLLVKGTFGIWQKERESAARVRELEDKARVVALRGEELRAGIASLSTDEGINEEIREKFDVSAEGEEMVIIVDPREKEAQQEEVKHPWYKRFWDAIRK